MSRALLLLTALLFSCSAQARVRPAAGGGYSIQIEDEYGRSLPTYGYHGGTYVLGQYNSRYNVRVSNHTGQRIEAVVTVDGRDSISGDLGDYTSQRGYVIQPYSSVVIDGFRRNMAETAAFRFTTPGDSYSGRRGTPQHTGVVGVAVFRERVYMPPPPPPVAMARKGATGGAPWGAGDDLAREESAAEPSAAPRASADAWGGESRAAPMPQRNNLGTRYGEAQYSPVVEVPFRRAHDSRPDQILAVYYDDASGLANRGIPVYSYGPYGGAEPYPFPQQRFAPPPP